MLNKGILLSGKEKLYNVYRGTVSNVSLSYFPQTDIKAGTRVNITVNANNGYQNPSVSVTKNDGTGSVTVSGSGSSRYFTMPKSDVTINASASLIPTYSVSGSASGGGISFSKTSGIRAGETITVYLSPNSYYVLSSLTSSPSVSFSGSGNTRTFKMPNSNVRITATFVANYTNKVTINSEMLPIIVSAATISPNTIYLFNKNLIISNIVTTIIATKSTITFSNLPGYAENYPNIKITRLDTNKTFTFTPERGSGKVSWSCPDNIFTGQDTNKTIYLKIYS